MKTIGLIGGTTWHSTLDYYRIINEIINEKLGAHHSAHLILYSVDFEEFVEKQIEKNVGIKIDITPMSKEK